MFRLVRLAGGSLSRRRSPLTVLASPPSPSLPLSASPPLLNMTLLGVGAGSLSALVGLGGGFVLIPSLTSPLVMGAVSNAAKRALTQHEAQATSLAVICVASIAGGTSYLMADGRKDKADGRTDKEGTGGGDETPPQSLEARLASFLETKSGKILVDACGISIGGLLTARFGVSVARGLDANKLKSLLGAFMVCVGPLVPLRGFLEKSMSLDAASSSSSSAAAAALQRPSVPPSPAGKPEHKWLEESAAATSPLLRRLTRRLTVALVRPPPDPTPASLYLRPLEMVGVGLFSGFLAGLFGVGGGALLVPTLAYIGPPPLSRLVKEGGGVVPPEEQHTFKDVLATSLLAMCLPALTAAYASRALVAPRVAAVLCLGSLVGSSATAATVAKVGREDPQLRDRVEDGLRWTFAVIMIVLGGRMFRSSRTAIKQLANSAAGSSSSIISKKP